MYSPNSIDVYSGLPLYNKFFFESKRHHKR
jgi:hypothetical protein